MLVRSRPSRQHHDMATCHCHACACVPLPRKESFLCSPSHHDRLCTVPTCFFSSFFKEEIIYHGHWPQHDHLLEISELITGSQLYCMHLYIYIYVSIWCKFLISSTEIWSLPSGAKAIAATDRGACKILAETIGRALGLGRPERGASLPLLQLRRKVKALANSPPPLSFWHSIFGLVVAGMGRSLRRDMDFFLERYTTRHQCRAGDLGAGALWAERREGSFLSAT
jgi:hypothetical protein